MPLGLTATPTVLEYCRVHDGRYEQAQHVRQMRISLLGVCSSALTWSVTARHGHGNLLALILALDEAIRTLSELGSSLIYGDVSYAFIVWPVAERLSNHFRVSQFRTDGPGSKTVRAEEK